MTALIIESALRGLLFAAVVGAGLSLLRVKHVPARKAAWTLVLAASIAMPLLIHWPLLAGLRARMAWAVPIATSESIPARSAVPALTAQRATRTTLASPGTPWSVDASAESLPPGDDALVTVGAPAIPAASPAASARRFTWPSIAQAVIWLYLVMAAALLLRLLAGLAAALRLWATAAPVSPLIAPVGSVRTSNRIASPVTVGAGVVLPADYAQWDRDRLRMVLAHERSHVRQMDFWLQLLAGLYTAAFWFSPLGWYLRRTLAQLGETISDRAGMEAARSGSEYAQVVLEFAAMPRRRLPGVAMASSGNLSRRIDSLLNESRFRSAFAEGRRRALAALLLIPVALFAAVVLIRVPAAAAQAVPANPGPTQAPEQPGQAAPSSAGPAQAPTAAPRTGQAFPGQAPNADQVSGPMQQAPPTPAPPAAAPAPIPVPTQRQTTVLQQTTVSARAPQTPLPPLPPLRPGKGDALDSGTGQSPRTSGTTILTTHHDGSTNSDFDYHASTDGNAWAVASGTWSDANLPSSLSASRRADIERAHRMANGPFLWFSRGGKSYVVTDPVAVGRIEGMIQAIGAVMGQQQFTVDVPNVSEVMAQAQAAMAKAQIGSKQQWVQSMAQYQAEMKAAQAQFSPERMAQMQKQIQDSMKSVQQWLSPQKQAQLQADLAQVEATLQKEQAQWNAQSQAQMQARMAEAQQRIAEAEKRMQEDQARWNSRDLQARMAEMQRRLAQSQERMQERSIDPEIERMIQQSIANGTAHPVQ